jgi:hypothetical protein
MTEIPFVAQLGDALEAAISEPHPRPLRRQPRRRVLVLGLGAAAALTLAALAVARVLSGPDELAARSVACYAAADLGSDVTVVANDRSPVAACAAAYRRMGVSVPPLVACAGSGAVAVIPGSDDSACTRLGLGALPAGYAASRAKVARLADGILALEASKDCIPPGELARGVRRLLDDQGWTGWTVELRAAGSGPCGSVSALDGAGRRRIEGALDPSQHVVFVFASPSRSTVALLYGRTGLARRLEDISGSRCFTVSSLTALVQSRVAAAGRAASVELAPPLPSTVTLADARQARYEAGCAILTDLGPAADGRDVVAVIPKAAS